MVNKTLRIELRARLLLRCTNNLLFARYPTIQTPSAWGERTRPPQYWQREGRKWWPRQSNKMRKIRGFPYHAGLFPTGRHKLLPNTCRRARAVLI